MFLFIFYAFLSAKHCYFTDMKELKHIFIYYDITVTIIHLTVGEISESIYFFEYLQVTESN